MTVNFRARSTGVYSNNKTRDVYDKALNLLSVNMAAARDTLAKSRE